MALMSTPIARTIETLTHHADVAFLQSIGVDVQAAVVQGGHEWTEEFRQSAADFLHSMLGEPMSR